VSVDNGDRLRRLLLISAAVALMIAFIGIARARIQRGRGDDQPVAAAGIEPANAPIAGEADLFRVQASDLALGPEPIGRRPAHPRVLATYRALRAYPGAPPRIPHGLTGEEFRTARCNTCHERGGYSDRFEAYTPVTPHPQLAECLQCHTASDRTDGIRLPDGSASARCRQCHDPAAPKPGLPSFDWQAAPWPTLKAASAGESPPPIPHDLLMRTNCIACHAGASAVAEIRTSHPERSNCRQCHLAGSP
jgi:cytochrome c-type protein NapB